MFTLFSSLAACSYDYNGVIDRMIEYAVSTDFNFYECHFIGVGTTDSTSPIKLYRGSTSYTVNLIANMFTNCKSNDGGSVSLWDDMNLHVRLLCVYNCIATERGGAFIIAPNQAYDAEFITAYKCESASRNCFFKGAPFIRNANVSDCKATRAKISDWSFGNVYFMPSMYGDALYCTVVDNYSPCSTLYFDHLVTSYIINSFNIISNQIVDYGLIYNYMSPYGPLYVRNAIIQRNTLNNKPVFDAHGGSIIVDYGNIVDRMDTWGSVTINGYELGSGLTEKLYQFYGTANCFAVFPVPRRSPTFAPTPENTPYTTPDTTPKETPKTTPCATKTPEKTPSETPFSTPHQTPLETTPQQSPDATATPKQTPKQTEEQYYAINSGKADLMLGFLTKQQFYICVGIIGGLVVIIFVLILIIMHRKRNDDDSSSFTEYYSEEMVEETVKRTEGFSSSTTHDNPLYTESEQADDLFAYDFDSVSSDAFESSNDENDPIIDDDTNKPVSARLHLSRSVLRTKKTRNDQNEQKSSEETKSPKSTKSDQSNDDL